MRTSFSTVCVKSSLRMDVLRSVKSALSSGMPPVLPGFLAVPKIEATDFFSLKSNSLCQRKRLPHNFVHRKCEEAHICSHSTPCPAQRARVPCRGRDNGPGSALQHFSRITLELAQKAGVITKHRRINHLWFKEGLCSHSFPQKVCIDCSLVRAGTNRTGLPVVQWG